MTENRNFHESFVSDSGLRQRAIQELRSLLPTGVDFVVDVSSLGDFDVRVEIDRGVYLLTFSIVIGLNEAKFQMAIRYAIDLIFDNLLRRPPIITPKQLEATTSFPSH